MIKHWYTNGIIDKKFYITDNIPDGFYRGRVNYGSGTKNTKWITNGVIQKLIKDTDIIPDGFWYGKLNHSKEHKLNISKALKGRVFTDEWKENISKGHKTLEYKQKVEATCLERYGVKNPYNKPEVIAKVHSKEIIQKQNETKRKNKTFNSSKAEDNFYIYLISKFNISDIKRQYYDEDRYPFACDFYIESLDLFIECNFHWTHNNHFYNPNDINDINILNSWKSKHTAYYNVACNVWSKKDLEKKQYGDNINYIVLWNQKSAIEEFENQLNNFI